MSFSALAIVCAVGLLGPVLAAGRRFAVPVVVGELVAGIIAGPMALGVIDAKQPTFAFLAQVGFALVMFVAGSHVPVGDPSLRKGLPRAVLRAVLVGIASVPVAYALATVFGTGHTALYAVLLASSSAALVLPIVQGSQITPTQGSSGHASLGKGSPPQGSSAHESSQRGWVLQLLPQVAIADAACIVALPLAVDPHRAGRAGLGALAVIAAAGVLFLLLRTVDRRGWRKRVHRLSERRKFAIELRINLALLFTLAAIATVGGVSIMLAGFAFGLAVAAIGEPRRLAKQLFAVTEGFFGPLFFVWLGASLDLQALGSHPALIALGVALGLGAVVTHLVTVAFGMPPALAALSAAQLGVPVAAATLGTTAHLLEPGEPAALVLGALVTVAVSALVTPAVARAGQSRPHDRAAPSATA